MSRSLPRLGASVLGMEAVVFALMIPVAVVIDGISPAIAGSVGGGLAVASIVIAGSLRRGTWAVYAAWALQVLAILTGFLVGIMFFLGALFAVIWISAVLVARRVDGVTPR